MEMWGEAALKQDENTDIAKEINVALSKEKAQAGPVKVVIAKTMQLP